MIGEHDDVSSGSSVRADAAAGDANQFVAVSAQQEFSVDDIVALEVALKCDPEASVLLVPLDSDDKSAQQPVELSIADASSVLRQFAESKRRSSGPSASVSASATSSSDLSITSSVYMKKLGTS
jgi:hypothetical protein